MDGFSRRLVPKDAKSSLLSFRDSIEKDSEETHWARAENPPTMGATSMVGAERPRNPKRTYRSRSGSFAPHRIWQRFTQCSRVFRCLEWLAPWLDGCVKRTSTHSKDRYPALGEEAHPPSLSDQHCNGQSESSAHRRDSQFLGSRPPAQETHPPIRGPHVTVLPLSPTVSAAPGHHEALAAQGISASVCIY